MSIGEGRSDEETEVDTGYHVAGYDHGSCDLLRRLDFHFVPLAVAEGEGIDFVALVPRKARVVVESSPPLRRTTARVLVVGTRDNS